MDSGRLEEDPLIMNHTFYVCFDKRGSDPNFTFSQTAIHYILGDVCGGRQIPLTNTDMGSLASKASLNEMLSTLMPLQPTGLYSKYTHPLEW